MFGREKEKPDKRGRRANRWSLSNETPAILSPAVQTEIDIKQREMDDKSLLSPQGMGTYNLPYRGKKEQMQDKKSRLWMTDGRRIE